MTREKDLRGFHLVHSFSRRSQCSIIFYIFQNTSALLKKSRVIFRSLGLFFCTQKFSPGLQKEGQLESFGLILDCFLESCRGFAPAPGSPAGLLAVQTPHVEGTWSQVWRGSLGALHPKYLPGSPTSWAMISDGELLLFPFPKRPGWKHPDLIFWGAVAVFFMFHTSAVLGVTSLSWGLPGIHQGCAHSLPCLVSGWVDRKLCFPSEQVTGSLLKRL